MTITTHPTKHWSATISTRALARRSRRPPPSDDTGLAAFLFEAVMKKKVVIKSSSLPMRSPVGFAVLYWLLLERIGAPGWAYGVLWTLVGIGAALYVLSYFVETLCDVPGFGDDSRG